MTLHTNEPDLTRIAFDVNASGSAEILIRRGGGSQQIWHNAGYVERLKANFT
jgi:hypothetical protein